MLVASNLAAEDHHVAAAHIHGRLSGITGNHHVLQQHRGAVVDPGIHRTGVTASNGQATQRKGLGRPGIEAEYGLPFRDTGAAHGDQLAAADINCVVHGRQRRLQ